MSTIELFMWKKKKKHQEPQPQRNDWINMDSYGYYKKKIDMTDVYLPTAGVLKHD